MTPHAWFVEHRTAYVTRSLDPADERTFADHLPRCADCRSAIADLERDLAWLPMGVRPAAPRPGLTRAVVERVMGARSRRRRWLLPAALAASLLLTLGLWVRANQRELAFAADAQTLRQQLTAVRDTLSITREAGKVLQATITMDGHQGGMMIFADDRTHRWNVVVHGLPPAAPGAVYQFWFICADGMVRGVQIHPEPARPAFMTLGMPATGGQVMGAALTLESAAAPSQGPTGKELVHLML